jgi:hypothetical protein
MSLSKQMRQDVEDVLRKGLRRKFQDYKPEPASMPFHTRLLGKDRMALFSFIHSLNTNFGTSIFEPVALVLAKDRFAVSRSQFKVGDVVTESAQYEIQRIMDELTAANMKPDSLHEIQSIRLASTKGALRKVKPTVVDVYLEDRQGHIFLFDIKTAKPNKGGFKEFKRTLLEWSAVILAQNPDAKVNAVIAIPYNPYEPKPYSRWTMAGMLDLHHELKVAEEFWDFLGGQGSYIDLLDCFERIGIELHDEIDAYFDRFV